MPRMTFAKDFDKQLEPNLWAHYQTGETYPVPDDLVEEVTAAGAVLAPEPAVAAPVVYDQPH